MKTFRISKKIVEIDGHKMAKAEVTETTDKEELKAFKAVAQEIREYFMEHKQDILYVLDEDRNLIIKWAPARPVTWYEVTAKVVGYVREGGVVEWTPAYAFEILKNI